MRVLLTNVIVIWSVRLWKNCLSFFVELGYVEDEIFKKRQENDVSILLTLNGVVLNTLIAWTAVWLLFLTEHQFSTAEYWPEVVTLRTQRIEVRTKTTKGQYSPVWYEQAFIVNSLLYGTRVVFIEFSSFWKPKHARLKIVFLEMFRMAKSRPRKSDIHETLQYNKTCHLFSFLLVKPVFRAIEKQKEIRSKWNVLDD